MKRGTLAALPQPLVVVDWRVVFVDPELKPGRFGWRKWLWRLSVWSGLHPFTTTLLQPKKHVNQWLRKEADKVSFEVLVVGTPSLTRAIHIAVTTADLWVAGTQVAASWNAAADGLRRESRLVELVVAEDTLVNDSMQGVPLVVYRGWGHQIGKHQ